MNVIRINVSDASLLNSGTREWRSRQQGADEGSHCANINRNDRLTSAATHIFPDDADLHSVEQNRAAHIELYAYNKTYV